MKHSLAFLVLGLFACGASTVEDTSESEGAFSFSRRPSTSLVRGRMVVPDAAIANALAQSDARATIAAYRDGELSGLVFRAGTELEGATYGIVCTPPTRDDTCVIRWLSKDRDTSTVVFGGKVGEVMAKVFGPRFEGDRMSIRCAEGSCTVTGLISNSLTFDAVAIDASSAQSVAGIR